MRPACHPNPKEYAMNDLRPIQTLYNDYRFRSRLEARWAVFFDSAGLKYRYEPEGFHLPRGNYLPDFYVEDWQQYVEVKPGPTSNLKIPRIYFAGRVNGGYRADWARTAHDNCWPSEDFIERQYHKDGATFSYWGPAVYDYNHGGDKQADWEGIFKNDLAQIRTCDVFFALIEDREVYGTLVEIGLARALNKEIVIGIADPISAECGSELDWDLWFALQCTQNTLSSKTADDILSQFLQWLTAKYPLPREIQLGRELTLNTNRSFLAVYGDPVDVLDNPNSILVGEEGIFRFSLPSYPGWYAAAAHARSARFDHGGTPRGPRT